MFVYSDPSSKPKVECSMVTEFTDHICVTMDAELIMFLHDLVSAYLKEKEKGLLNSTDHSSLHIIHLHMKNSHQPSPTGSPTEESHSSSRSNRKCENENICLPLHLWSCLYAVGCVFEDGERSVISAHSREVREPEAGSILMAFTLSPKNKWSLFVLAKPAFFTTIKPEPNIFFCLFWEEAKEASAEAFQLFHPCLINPD